MANVLIVEDEEVVAEGLSTIVKSIDSEIDVTITGYAKEALNYAKEINYDMFLLDIQLLDYSGFELSKEIRNFKNYKLTPIVFITAIPTRELMAFKQIHCYDYIVKPFKEEEVKNTLETIINYGITKEEKSTYLKIEQKYYSYFIKQDEIIYMETRNRKIFIVTINEQIELSNHTLKELLDKLDANFLRCHKGYIININYIEKIDKTNNDVYLEGIELPIPVGRKYKDDMRRKNLWN